MNKRTYFLLSGLFFAAFLTVQFTNIYGNAGWVKLFFILLGVGFLSGGLSNTKGK